VSGAQWSLTVAVLVAAVATPLLGALGDGRWRRPVLLGALAAVLLGCVLAALPFGSYPLLLLGRGLQGLGLGLVPLAIAVAREQLSPERSGPAVSLLSITTVVGVGLGYPVTGLLATRVDFHASFWFAAAVASAALLAAALVVPDNPGVVSRRLDLSGAALLAAALVCLLYGLAQGETWGWLSWRLGGLLALAAVLLWLWGRHELANEAPLVDLRLARHPTVLTANITALVAGIGMYLLLSLVTRFVQTPSAAGYGFGASVVVAGLAMAPFSVASVLSSRLVGLTSERLTADLVLPLGCGIFVVAMGTFAMANSSLWLVFVVMAVAGLGVGCTFAALPALVLRAVPLGQTGSAMSFNQVLRSVGYSIGSALAGSVLQAFTAGSGPPRLAGYRTAALLGCGVWVAAGVVSFALPRRAARVDAEAQLLMQESLADGVPWGATPAGSSESDGELGFGDGPDLVDGDPGGELAQEQAGWLDVQDSEVADDALDAAATGVGKRALPDDLR
jgi:predicted MFS family arabinose efflux permease